MTNYEWIKKHKFTDLIFELAREDYKRKMAMEIDTFYSTLIMWLILERGEENVQLPENKES